MRYDRPDGLAWQVEQKPRKRKQTATERAREKGFDTSTIKEDPILHDVFTGKRMTND